MLAWEGVEAVRWETWEKVTASHNSKGSAHVCLACFVLLPACLGGRRLRRADDGYMPAKTPMPTMPCTKTKASRESAACPVGEREGTWLGRERERGRREACGRAGSGEGSQPAPGHARHWGKAQAGRRQELEVTAQACMRMGERR